MEEEGHNNFRKFEENSTALVLVYLNLNSLFIVEIDVCEVRMGAFF